MKNSIVITRHQALVAYLIEQGIITKDTPVLPHVTSPEEVRGKVVIGPCPLHLAAEAESVVHIPIEYPRDGSLRGVELTLEQLREMAGAPVQYTVRTKPLVEPDGHDSDAQEKLDRIRSLSRWYMYPSEWEGEVDSDTAPDGPWVQWSDIAHILRGDAG
jgi:hypothetical protein